MTEVSVSKEPASHRQCRVGPSPSAPHPWPEPCVPHLVPSTSESGSSGESFVCGGTGAGG